MPRDPEAFADAVLLMIKAALTPVLVRVAGMEARLTQALTVEPSVVALRDRVVAVETKCFTPVPAIEAPDTLTPVLERVASLEAQVKQALAVESSVTALRERVVVVETKAATPVAVPEAHESLSPVLERLAANEARVARLAAVELTVGELHDRQVAFDAKAAVPVEAHPSGPSAADIELSVRDALEPLVKALAAAQERIAVLEVRASVPGPAGKDGAPGVNGKDGTDGVTLDDLSLVQDNDRTLVVRGTVGARVKDIGSLTLPVEIYRGVYVDGKTYDRGDGVTMGGSEWHCNETTTTKPGDGSKAWTLKVKRGRDGKDGRDAVTVPVVSLGRPQ